MKTLEVHQALATHMHEWKKWPDTGDTDYSSVFAERPVSVFHRGETELRVISHYLPVYAAYLRAGKFVPDVVKEQLVPGKRFPVINNLRPPADAVLSAQRETLAALSAEVGGAAILWDHAHECYPAVAEVLPSLFRLRALSFADDCPGSSDEKTFPIAAYFNAMRYVMHVFSAQTGALTVDEYRKRGITFFSFSPSDATGGLREGLVERGFSIEGKQALIRSGKASPDIVFVGYFGGGARARLMHGLSLAHARQKALGMSLRLYGVSCPDGILEPRFPFHEKGQGYPFAALYADGLSGPNAPVSSIFNSRLADLFFSGVCQLIYDPWSEMKMTGMVAGEDYLSIEADAADVLVKVEWLRQHPAEAAEMVGRAHAKAKRFWDDNSWENAWAKIYFGHLEMLTGDAGR